MKEFWNSRAERYGHTGWADNFIYAYDQQARLLTVEKILKSLNCSRSLALDFGTGSGDFANLLSKYFEKVIAFDISDTVIEIAKEKYDRVRNIQFYFSSHIEEIEIPNNTVDLVLSVTVLDHIMDDSELIETLKFFWRILKDKGFLVALESAYDYEKPKTLYKKFTKFREWLSIFSNCDFSLHKYYQFHDPIECPRDSYLSYRSYIGGIKGKILRLLIKYVNHRLVDRYLNRLASEHLQGKDDFFWEGDTERSPIKIMVFRKLER
jgi:ubiquinone/menaquinone biosynthesis C-methylase UbiE